MGGENLVVIEGKVLGNVKHYNDTKPKTVFTVMRGRDRFYVESLVQTDENGPASGVRVLVVGSLFSRRVGDRDFAAIRATRVVPLAQAQEEARNQ